MGSETANKPASPQGMSSGLSREELPYRLGQQSLLVEFGKTALQAQDVERILQRSSEGNIPFGVLEVDSRDPGRFDNVDVNFLAASQDFLVLPSNDSKPTPSSGRHWNIRLC